MTAPVKGTDVTTAGGSLGGPVYLPKIYNGKDKTFFYVAYERYQESSAGGGSPIVTVPLNDFWSGNLSRLLGNQVIGQDALGRNIYQGAIYDPSSTSIMNGQMVRDPFPGNIIPLQSISAPARKLGAIFMKDYAPTVKGPDGQIALLNNAFFPVSNQAGFTQNQFSLKADHSLSPAQKISGSFVYVDRPRVLLDQGGVWDFNDPTGGPLSRSRLQWVRSWYGRMAYDWTMSPSILNHLQLGFNRQRNPSLSTHLGEDGVTALGLQGLSKNYNYPEINFGSNNYLVNYPTLGYQTNDFGAGQNFQIIDTVTWIKNRHSIRAGVDWRRSYLRWRTDNGPAEIDFSQAQTGLQGFNQTGNGFASMLLGQVATADVPLSTPTGSRFLNLALFLQDDFKVTSRLTLNLGIRWDYQPLPVEQYNRLGNFNPSLIDPVWGLPGALEFASASQRTFAPNHYRDFSPRFGFAYQAANKTVIRGAYGMFYLARNGNGWSGVPWGQTAGFGQQDRVTSTVDYQSAWNWSNSVSRRGTKSSAERLARERIAGRMGNRQLRSRRRQERLRPAVEFQHPARIAVPDGSGHRLRRLEEHRHSGQRAARAKSARSQIPGSGRCARHSGHQPGADSGLGSSRGRKISVREFGNRDSRVSDAVAVTRKCWRGIRS